MITCSYDMSFKNWKYIWVSWIFINFNEFRLKRLITKAAVLNSSIHIEPR